MFFVLALMGMGLLLIFFSLFAKGNSRVLLVMGTLLFLAGCLMGAFLFPHIGLSPRIPHLI